jgi:hypothetical protein
MEQLTPRSLQRALKFTESLEFSMRVRDGEFLHQGGALLLPR